MGKYQLDYKGMQQVKRFHEKHSNVKTDKKARVSQLKAQFLEKAKNDNVHLIIAEVMEENIPSCKLLERHGFKVDGVIRKKYKDRYGIYRNIKVYTYLVNED